MTTVTAPKKKRTAGRPRTVEPYDFSRPTTLAREHSRALELAFETFARQWGTQLTSRVRSITAVTCEDVLMQTYDEYVAALPSTTSMVLFRLADFDSKAVIQFPSSSGLAWVGRMLGGNGSIPKPDRKFSEIEQSLVRRLMEDAVEDLRYSMGPLMPAGMDLDTIQYNSQFAQAAATTDLMVVARFTIRVGENNADASLAIPAEALLPQLGATNPTTSAENAPALLRGQLSRVPVTVALGPAPTTVKPEQVLKLAVGDLLRLPHPETRPMELTVDGKRIARANLGKSGVRIAAKIVELEEN